MVANIERRKGSTTIFQGRLLTLRVDSIELPSGRETTREIVEHIDSVVIVPVDSDSNVLLVRQYRTAIGRVLLELPAGKTEPNESPLQTAHRELQEETGYKARNMEPLGGFYAGPGYSTEYLHLFLATDLVSVETVLDDDEIMDMIRVPLNSVPKLISDGEIPDAKSIAGLLRAMWSRDLSA